MQATEILLSLGGRLVHVMCLFICIVMMIIIFIYFYFYFFCIKYYIQKYMLSGDVTVMSKAAEVPQSQLVTRMSAGRVLALSFPQPHPTSRCADKPAR